MKRRLLQEAKLQKFSIWRLRSGCQCFALLEKLVFQSKIVPRLFTTAFDSIIVSPIIKGCRVAILFLINICSANSWSYEQSFVLLPTASIPILRRSCSAFDDALYHLHNRPTTHHSSAMSGFGRLSWRAAYSSWYNLHSHLALQHLIFVIGNSAHWKSLYSGI